MEINTWQTPCGEWKAQFVSPIAKGATREEAIEALKGLTHPIESTFAKDWESPEDTVWDKDEAAKL
jgi:hypothetical protein